MASAALLLTLGSGSSLSSFSIANKVGKNKKKNKQMKELCVNCRGK